MTDRRVRILRFYLLLAALAVASVVWPEWAVFCWPLVGIIPCSSCCGCTFFTDNFTTDNLAANYDERSGSFTVSGGELTTADASALLICNTTLPSGYTGIFATATVVCDTTSDIGRLAIAYSDDSNYWFLEVQPGATNGTLKLFERSGGADTQMGTTRTLIGFAAGTTATVQLCAADGSVTATAIVSGSPHEVLQFTASPTLTSTKCGVGTGAGSSNVAFDNFRLSKHHVDDTACPTCLVCENCLPAYFGDYQVVISGVANANCSNCNIYNGTFEAPRLAACAAGFTIGTTLLCASGNLPDSNVSVNESAPTVPIPFYHTRGTLGANSGQVTFFTAAHGSEPDCSAFSSLSLGPSGSNFLCDISTATFLITAI